VEGFKVLPVYLCDRLRFCTDSAEYAWLAARSRKKTDFIATKNSPETFI